MAVCSSFLTPFTAAIIGGTFNGLQTGLILFDNLHKIKNCWKNTEEERVPMVEV